MVIIVIRTQQAAAATGARNRGLGMRANDMAMQCTGMPDFHRGPVRSIRMASNGQWTAHRAQPVQPAGSRSTDRLGPQGSEGAPSRPGLPPVSSDSTCGAQTATHRPQPVQRSGSMAGRALGVEGGMDGRQGDGTATVLACCRQ